MGMFTIIGIGIANSWQRMKKSSVDWWSVIFVILQFVIIVNMVIRYVTSYIYDMCAIITIHAKIHIPHITLHSLHLVLIFFTFLFLTFIIGVSATDMHTNCTVKALCWINWTYTAATTATTTTITTIITTTIGTFLTLWKLILTICI